MKIGFIGLGNMGGPMAANLAAAGHDVCGFDITAPMPTGVTKADSAASAASGVDVVITMLPNGAILRSVAAEVIPAMQANAVLCDCSTVDVDSARAVADQAALAGLGALDAPVSGGAAGAKAGTIAIMVGGANDTVAELRPVFEQISPNIFECGDIGAGQVMKLINNMVSTCNRLAMLEGVTMGQRNGLDLSVMCDVLNAGGARSKASENMLPAIVEGVPDSFFLLQLMLKDLNLAAALGTETGVPLQFGQLARGMLQAASNTLGPEANLLDISDYIATEAGTSFKRAT